MLTNILAEARVLFRKSYVRGPGVVHLRSHERAVEIMCNLIVGAIANALFGDPATARRESTTLRV